MKIQRKTVSILVLTPKEVEQFYQMLGEATEGHMAHYSERQTGPNQFFGISVQEQTAPPSPAGNGGDKRIRQSVVD